MPKVNVTRLIDDVVPSEISGSVAERGQDAAKETWNNAIDATKDDELLKPEERQSVRDAFAEFGAWDRDEIDAWSDNELDALVLQYAAGDLRELQSLAPGDGLGDIDWDEAEKLSNDGVCNVRLYASGGTLYISID